jgi:hypothetical protein
MERGHPARLSPLMERGHPARLSPLMERGHPARLSPLDGARASLPALSAQREHLFDFFDLRLRRLLCGSSPTFRRSKATPS